MCTNNPDENRLRRLHLIGCEGFTNGYHKQFNKFDPKVKEAYVNLLEKVCETDEAIGMSDHFLVICQKT